MTEPACCYICLEADAEVLAGVCACRDRAVHAACLARWVAQSQSGACPVCRAAYVGVCVSPRAAPPAAAAPGAVPAGTERVHAAVCLLLVGMGLGFGTMLVYHGMRALDVGCTECLAIVVVLGVAYLAIFAAACECVRRPATAAIQPVVASTVDPAWPL